MRGVKIIFGFPPLGRVLWDTFGRPIRSIGWVVVRTLPPELVVVIEKVRKIAPFWYRVVAGT